MATILVVDDDQNIRTTLDLRLLMAGHHVETAGNGQEAVEAALRLRPDLILLDHHMPVMDGLTAVRTLRARGYAGTICALTASTLMGDPIRESFAAACDHFLAKPFGDDLERAIETMTGGE